MNPCENESYESWCNRVSMYEKGYAMMQLAQGKDSNRVLEEMSRRIMGKLLHPIYKSLQSPNLEFDVKKSAKEYTEMMKNRSLVADHVDTDT